MGLVYSQQTAWTASGECVRERVEDPSLGWYQALVESRIPFEMVHDRLLDASCLAALRTLVLPNVEPPVSVSGPGVVDVAVWRQRSSLTVHLVNLTNPMMMKGPVRELLPLGEQYVRVHLPDGVSAKQVALLVGGGSPPFRQSGAWLETAVPTIVAHEVVAIDTSSSC